MQLYLWRHPKPKNTAGLCYGQSEVTIDNRKVKCLANQINHYVRRNKLPKLIWVSPLGRSKNVGIQLQKLGFQYNIDSRLMETHFGAWENKQWSLISKAEIDSWCNDFAEFAPEGGESLSQLFNRTEDWLIERLEDKFNLGIDEVLVVGHAGWITTLQMIVEGQGIPYQANDWPLPISHGKLTVLEAKNIK